MYYLHTFLRPCLSKYHAPLVYYEEPIQKYIFQDLIQGSNLYLPKIGSQFNGSRYFIFINERLHIIKLKKSLFLNNESEIVSSNLEIKTNKLFDNIHGVVKVTRLYQKEGNGGRVGSEFWGWVVFQIFTFGLSTRTTLQPKSIPFLKIENFFLFQNLESKKSQINSHRNMLCLLQLKVHKLIFLESHFGIQKCGLSLAYGLLATPTVNNVFELCNYYDVCNLISNLAQLKALYWLERLITLYAHIYDLYFLYNNKYLKSFEDKSVLLRDFLFEGKFMEKKLLANFHDFDVHLFLAIYNCFIDTSKKISQENRKFQLSINSSKKFLTYNHIKKNQFSRKLVLRQNSRFPSLFFLFFSIFLKTVRKCLLLTSIMHQTYSLCHRKPPPKLKSINSSIRSESKKIRPMEVSCYTNKTNNNYIFQLKFQYLKVTSSLKSHNKGFKNQEYIFCTSIIIILSKLIDEYCYFKLLISNLLLIIYYHTNQHCVIQISENYFYYFLRILYTENCLGRQIVNYYDITIIRYQGNASIFMCDYSVVFKIALKPTLTH
ncbi:hypothetical protein AGLY_000832 [Aphis glycines]|uniref:Uncharacterized protein n=1 Tax=Aphis glycines TaxID=307491 RepID=A0A6G0U9M1_APHGL|nr:hypothetical protein AGLY_000832 [Aphis glycines]